MEAVGFQLVTFFKGNPPTPYTAARLTIGDRLGNQKEQDWLGFPPALAQRLLVFLQEALAQGQGQPLPSGRVLH